MKWVEIISNFHCVWITWRAGPQAFPAQWRCLPPHKHCIV